MDLTLLTVAELEAHRAEFAEGLAFTRKALSHYDTKAQVKLRTYECALACIDAVIAQRAPRPLRVCLCGSTRFWRTFQQASLQETLAGRIVLSIGAASGTDDEHFGNLPRAEYEQVKTMLDELHLRKIDLADEVLVLNVDGYVGNSTRREIAYAIKHGKPVRFWEPEHAPVLSAFPPFDLMEIAAP